VKITFFVKFSQEEIFLQQKERGYKFNFFKQQTSNHLFFSSKNTKIFS